MGTIRIQTRVVVWRDDGPHVATSSNIVEDPRSNEVLTLLTAGQIATIVVEETMELITHECELPVDQRQWLVGNKDRNN